MFSVLGAERFPALPADGTDAGAAQQPALRLLADRRVATDDVDPEYLEKPRQWDIGDITRFMLFIGPAQLGVRLRDLLHACCTSFGGWTHPALFQTGWFVESLLSQTLIMHVIRTGKIPFLQSRASAALMGTTTAICLLGLWLPVSHFAHALNLVPLPHEYLLALLAILAAYMTLDAAGQDLGDQALRD